MVPKEVWGKRLALVVSLALGSASLAACSGDSSSSGTESSAQMTAIQNAGFSDGYAAGTSDKASGVAYDGNQRDSNCRFDAEQVYQSDSDRYLYVTSCDSGYDSGWYGN